ncbi:short-chain dehydrogenase [Paenibacillus sp. BIHB 4019]|uniref:Short-chain dehydrogenase n=1 Tax=Paenibacillus sp. BIHB 4019 TaxID=1870819 RepID=A0A1B2DMT8_9BACL|nr:SDR family oxidoreductase [Paenibacillus sp. BIHB 4019]ANY69024.1 short-chain dehydrogenase [Paenibacillus sp. BIHB 4019]
MRFNQKVVLVTGGGSGIGEACVEMYAAEGAHVVIADLNALEAQRVAEGLLQKYRFLKGLPKILALQADVSQEESVTSLMEATLQAFGRLDVLINNAAIICPKPIEDIDEQAFDRLYAVNVKGVYLMIKHAIPHLRSTKGNIVNLASLNGLVGQRNNAVYAASKGAVIAMTKSLALDFAPSGVRINCVCPAGVMTPLLEEWVQQQIDPAAAQRTLDEMHPLGRPANAAEIAQAVLYLASEQASFITGVALPVEGGASLGY